MAKARKKPSPPPLPPEWVQTPAQMAMQITYRPKGEGRNIIMRRRARAYEILESKLSARQQEAACEISDRYAATQRSPSAALSEAVDSGANFGEANVEALNAQQRFDEIRAMCPAQQWPVVEHVCCFDRCIRDGLAKKGIEGGMYLAQLKVGLDIVANKLQIN